MRAAFIQGRCVFYSPNFHSLFKLNYRILSLCFDYIPLSVKHTGIKKLFLKFLRLVQT